MRVIREQQPNALETLSWWNFRTGGFDARAAAPTTDAEARDYLPQHDVHQRLYAVLRELDVPVLEALRLVLEQSMPPVPNDGARILTIW